MTLRQDKVSENIKNLMADFLERESNRTSLITVTDSSVSKDLRKATVFFTVLPQEAEESALNFIKRKRGDARDFLKKNLKARAIPFLDFEIDLGEKHRQRIDELSEGL